MLLRIFAGLITTSTMLMISMPAQAAPVTYQLDPNHTSVLWHISHFGFSNPSGKWQADGTLILDEQKPQDSKVNVTIKIASVDTGIPKLDEHLKSKAFFDADQFPTATFVSDKVKLTGKDTAQVTGMLTMHGVTKPVTLNVKLNKIGTNPITEKKAAGFSAETTIDRSDFGIETLSPALGNKVKVNIEAEGQAAE
ncbi:MAG: YceI family protein [Pseudomonadota bacterium]